MRIRHWSHCVLLIGGLTACGSQTHRAQPPPPQTATPVQSAQEPGCPTHSAMHPDPSTTRIETTDTSSGVAIVFTTTNDVADLRERVHRMADMHNRTHAGGGMHGMHGGGMHHDMMVPSTATAEDIEGGARIILVPTDPAQLATLRQQAQMHVAMMQKGQCPMMSGSA